MTNTLLVIFVEGETDPIFYRTLVEHMHKEYGRFHCKVRYKNLKGSSNYRTEAYNYYKKEIISRYGRYKHKIILCYDTDVFERPGHIPVDWNKVEKALRQAGSKKILRIEARRTIEDWFFYDREGIRNYLNLSKTLNMNKYQGPDDLKVLFRMSGKLYVKGMGCKDLVKSLDMDLILAEIQDEIRELLLLLR